MKRKLYSYLLGLSTLLLVGFANLNANSTLFSLHHTDTIDCSTSEDSSANLVNDVYLSAFLNAQNTNHSKGLSVTIVDVLEFEEIKTSDHSNHLKNGNNLHVFQGNDLRCLLEDYQQSVRLTAIDNFTFANKIYLNYQVLLI
tara:strand:- start:6145 stop:6570 length:426 start_codon:yes stop_codon:yes gene_type:complete